VLNPSPDVLANVLPFGHLPDSYVYMETVQHRGWNPSLELAILMRFGTL